MMDTREKAALERKAEKEIENARKKNVHGLTESLALMFKSTLDHYDEQEPYDYYPEDYDGPYP